jgi:hypothetical protein
MGGRAHFYKFKITFLACSVHILVNFFSTFLISNFRLLLNVVCFLLGNSPASEDYMPTFRNTLFHLHMKEGVCRMN